MKNITITMELILADIALANAEIKRLNGLIGQQLEDAAKLAPFKVGDVVKCNGFAWRDQDLVITKIWFAMEAPLFAFRMNIPHFSKPSWVAEGYIKKKDGTTGERRGFRIEPYI
jgi:hypothetical protein